jgi:hypothetical protein
MLWLTAALLGCTGALTEENYAGHYAKAACQALKECERSTFMDQFGDTDECREELEDAYDPEQDIFKDCDFSADEAENCLDGIREYAKTCDYGDFEYDNCADVWDCGNVTTPVDTSRYTYYGDY